MEWKGVDCIYIAKAVDTVMDLRVPHTHNAGNYVTG